MLGFRPPTKEADMAAQVLDGKALAKRIQKELTAEFAALVGEVSRRLEGAGAGRNGYGEGGLDE